jgi:hypothetical protein
VENGHKRIYLFLLLIYGIFSSVVGLTLNTPGDLAISLGTSDTVSLEGCIVYLAYLHKPCMQLSTHCLLGIWDNSGS